MRRSVWVLLGLLLACGAAHSQQVTCSAVSATSVSGTYTPTADLNLTGTITLTCTRNAGAKTRSLWVGIDNGPGTPARNLDRAGGGDNLPYGIYRNAAGTGQWTTGAGQAAGSPTAGGTLVAFNFNAANTQSVVTNYYFKATLGNYAQTGTYNDNAINITVKLDTATGTTLGTTTLNPSVTVNAYCSITQAPGTLTFNYVAFTGTPQTPSTNLFLLCNRQTTYTMSIGAASDTKLGLSYSLAIDTSSGLSGSGVAKQYFINGTMAAGQGGQYQAGNCAGATCSITVPRTLTVSY